LNYAQTNTHHLKNCYSTFTFHVNQSELGSYLSEDFNPLIGLNKVDGFLVSKETVVLRRWRVKQKLSFIERVDEGLITTVKGFES